MTLPIERITTVLAAAASYDLTDLETVKDELSIGDSNTSDDSWLTRAIGQVSRAIERHCNRRFVPEQLQDLFQFGRDPFPGARFGGEDEIALARWPLLSVGSVSQSLPNGVTKTLVAGTDFLADLAKGRLLRLRSDGRIQRWEAFPLSVQYTAGYGALVQENDAVPSAAPYTVAVSQASAFSCDQSVAYASGTALARVAANPAQGQYSVAGGIYTFNAADEGQALAFAYATAAVPDDLVEICLRLITARYSAKDRDPNLIQQDTPGVGTQRWWFGGAPGQKGAFPPDIEAALEDYRPAKVA
jgi:hypothetical protein